MRKKKLQIEQLNAKIKVFADLVNIAAPPTGWTKAIRIALGMSLQQLANRLSMTKQSAQEIEKREKEGLLIPAIATRAELNEFEQQNIEEACSGL